MCSDSYTLRLSNVANTDNGDLVRLSANKDEYTVRIPNDLRAKGKCKLSVNSVHIQTKKPFTYVAFFQIILEELAYKCRLTALVLETVFHNHYQDPIYQFRNF